MRSVRARSRPRLICATCVERYGWTRPHINLAFEALADIPVLTAEGSCLIFDRDLTPREAAALTRERLIRLDRNGRALTREGEELLSLLLAYGDPQHEWGRPLITFWDYMSTGDTR